MLLQLLQEGHEVLLVFLLHGRLMRMSTKYVGKNSFQTLQDMFHFPLKCSSTIPQAKKHRLALE
jgi:hypothetical protein